MEDKELLELAAKAAGHSYQEWVPGHYNPKGDWNPLTDDGDALRLAVKLELIEGLAIDFRQGEMDGPDPYAATRRAIVRAAAAEIGREMK
jgi:hypothetical protein